MLSHPSSGALGGMPEPRVAQSCGTVVLVALRAGHRDCADIPVPCPVLGSATAPVWEWWVQP